MTADHRCSRGATREIFMLISGALVGGAGELVWQCRASRRQKSPRALVGSVLLTSPQEHSLERSTRRCIAVCQTGEKQKTERRKSKRQEMIKLAQAKKPTWTAAAMYVAAAAGCTTARDAGQLPAGRPGRRDLAGRPPQRHCAHGQLGMVVIRHSFAAHRPPVTSHLQQRKKKG